MKQPQLYDKYTNTKNPGKLFELTDILIRHDTTKYCLIKCGEESDLEIVISKIKFEDEYKKATREQIAEWTERHAPSSFAMERQKTSENSTRYGKDLLDNFNVDTDLVVWPINNEFDQLVTFEHPEIIGRCPVSGYPDTYKCKVSFVTDTLTMELKAFKLWLNSYYNKQVSHEYLGQEIFSIFWNKVKPKYLKVELFPAPRGNITTVVTTEKYNETKPINGVINGIQSSNS